MKTAASPTEPTASPYPIPGLAIMSEVRAAHRVVLDARRTRGPVLVLRVTDSSDAPDSASDRPARLLRRLGVPVAVVTLPATATTGHLRRVVRHAVPDSRIAAVRLSGPVPARLRAAVGEMFAQEPLDTGSCCRTSHCTGACCTAEAVVRVVRPFLGRADTCVVVGGRTGVGAEIAQILQETGTRTLLSGPDDDLRVLHEADVVVGADPGRADRLGAAVGRRATLVVDTCGLRSPVESGGHPRAVLADPAALSAVETAVLSERVVQELAAPGLAPWRYLVAGPAGRLTSAMADAVTALTDMTAPGYEIVPGAAVSSGPGVPPHRDRACRGSAD